jgi:hypothetical protein
LSEKKTESTVLVKAFAWKTLSSLKLNFWILGFLKIYAGLFPSKYSKQKQTKVYFIAVQKELLNFLKFIVLMTNTTASYFNQVSWFLKHCDKSSKMNNVIKIHFNTSVENN